MQKLLLPVVVACITSACVTQGDKGIMAQIQSNLEDASSQFQQALQGGSQTSNASVAPGGPNITDTRLYRIFERYPFDSTQPFDQQFPRVALTVVTSPPNHRDMWQIKQTSGCFQLSAVLWTTRTKSEQVAPFTVCFPRDAVSDVPMRGASDWAGRSRFFANAQETTGTKRTDGPVPPSNPIPSDLAHKQYFGSSIGIQASHLDGAMFAIVLMKMGFDWENSADRRVWITKFNAAVAPDLKEQQKES